MDEGKELILTVLLYVKPGQFEGFREYESKAIEIMQEYGGKLEKAIAPASINSSTLSLPDEIHLVSFKNKGDFDRYQSDPRIAKLKSLRDSTIAETIVIAGKEWVWQEKQSKISES